MSLTMSNLVFRVFGVLLICLFATQPAWCQYTTGQVNGVIKDASGAVIPNSSVVLRNKGTGAIRTAKTDTEGFYTFPAVPAADYELSADAQGFSKTTISFTVVTNQTLTENIDLRIASSGDVVEVRDQSAVSLIVSDAQLSTTRLQEELVNLPVIGRTVTSLAAYTAGVQPTQNPRGGSLSITSGSQAGFIAANGGRARATAVQLDFTDVNDWEFGGAALRSTPNEDLIQEFKVLTSNFAAEHGVKSNAQVIMVTKSGTNNIHGTAYDFVQNDIFNARNYFDTTGKPSVIKRNNYGFSLGGPVIKGRTYAFGGFDATIQKGAGSTVIASVPTAAARATATPLAQQLMAQFIPLPTTATADPNVGTITNTLSSPNDGKQWVLKIDHQLNAKNSISGRYLHAWGNSKLRFAALNTLPGFDTDFVSFARNLSISETWIPTSQTVNQLRVAYNRSAGFIVNEDGLVSPRYQITGLVNFGALNLFPNTRLFNVYQINDVVTHNKGAHSFRFGGDARKIQDNSLLPANAHGLFTFPTLNSFLAGQPSSWTQTYGEQYRGFRTALYGLFFQDDWKASPTLTLNLGIRWELQGAMSEAKDLTSVLDFNHPGTVGNAGTGSLGSFHVGNPSVDANPLNFAPRVGFAWNPHNGNLVIRGGYGIFWDSFNFTPQTFSRSAPPLNYSVSLAGAQISGVNNFAALNNGTAPFSLATASQVGTFGSLQNFGELQSIDRSMSNPYAQHFSLGGEYRFFSNYIARIGYVGTTGTHLTVFTPINPVVTGPAPATSLADETARLSQFQAAVGQQNGANNSRLDKRFDQISLHTDRGSSNYHSLQVELNKSFTKEGLMFRFGYTWSKSIDNASDFTTEQQANDNNFAQTTYNLIGERGVSNFDIPHRYVFTWIWNLPMYKSQKGPLGRILGGWSWQSAALWQSGVPGTLLSGSRRGIQDSNLDGNLIPRVGLDNTRANCAAGAEFHLVNSPNDIPAPGIRGVNNSANSSNFGFTQALLGNAGTCGRNSVRLNSLTNVDMSISKNILLIERGFMGSGPWNLQFRTEAYNVFNTQYLTVSGNAWRTVSSSQFAVVNSAGATRRLQLALKLIW